MKRSIYNFEKMYDKGMIREYEQKVISDGICESFIPISFIDEGSKMRLIYKYDGYLMISECRFRQIIQLFNIIDLVIMNVEEAFDYMIEPARLEIKGNTVFYRRDTEEIRLAFSVSDNDSGFTENLISFMNELMLRYDGNSGEYMDKLKEYILKYNPDFSSIRKKIKELKMQIRKLGIV